MNDTSPQILHGKVIFNLGKRIPSAEAAAGIKFGVEKVIEGSKVHFVGEDIEVVLGVEGAVMGAILEVLGDVGFPSAVVAGTATAVESECTAPAPIDEEGNEEGEAIA